MNSPFVPASLVRPGLLAVVLLATLAACNTIEGAGRDIEATGDAIEGAAQDTKEEF